MVVGLRGGVTARAATVLVCALAAMILLPNLGGYALWDPDEARHAEVGREMFAATDWRGFVVPSLNFAPYHDKPVLFYWAASAAYALGGVCEGSVRTVPALSGVATTLLVFAWSAATWDVATGLAAAAILLSSVEFAGLGRYADLNMLLTLWITLGCLAVQRWADAGRERSPAGLLVAAVAAALGMLTKGFVAPVLIAGVLLGHLLWTRRLGRLREAPWVRLVLAVGLVAGPWYLLAGVLDRDYLYEFVMRHHVERFVRPGTLLHGKSLFFYVPIVVGGFFPWSMLLPGMTWWIAVSGRKGVAERFCVWWAAAVLGFFTMSQGKLGTYILPAFPPLALLAGRWVTRVLRREGSVGEGRLFDAGAWVAMALFLLTPVGVYATTGRVQHGALRGLTGLALVLPPVAAFGMYALWRRQQGRAVGALVACMVVALVVFYRWGAPLVSAVQSEAPLARLIRDADGHDGSTPVLTYSVRTPSLLFYLQRRVEHGNRPADLERVLAASPRVFVVTSRRHVPDLVATGRLVPWHTAGHHLLFASMPAPG